jgi:hypothetical protein
MIEALENSGRYDNLDNDNDNDNDNENGAQFSHRRWRP